MVTKKTPGMEFQIFIDDLIRSRGLSVSKVARDTHIPADSLRRYSRGYTMIPVQYLFVLADYFRCPISEVINYRHRGKNNILNHNIYTYSYSIGDEFIND